MRAAAAAALAVSSLLLPATASARAAATVDGGSVVFFADTLTLVARDGADARFADGTRAHADAAYVDLRSDRIVVAGHVRLDHGERRTAASAAVLDLDGDRVDLLDAASGAARTTRALGTAVAEELDAARFAFPDVDDRSAYIRSRRATIVPGADVRFTPAAFPSSVGAVPVPSYLYTYATGGGFASSSLGGATFDQPYGLFGSRSSLTALHARWEDGPGAAVALEQHLVGGDNAYLTAAVDAPLRGTSVTAFNAYRRMGSRFTAIADGTGTPYGSFQHVGLTGAFTGSGASLDYRRSSAGYSAFDATLRTLDRPLAGGVTWRLSGTLGFDAQRNGLLYELPDRHAYATVWRHALALDLATPTLRAPFGTTVTASADVSRTWYAFPHRFDAVGGTVTASRPLLRSLTLFAGYQAAWSSDVYPNAQAIFYPSPSTPLVTPDGALYAGYAAFTGARTLRAQSARLEYVRGLTSLRLAAIHTDDFPQYAGYGRPQWEARVDAKLRPFPNIGLDVGRAYDFAWGGTRWQPRWNFAITP